MTQEGILRLGDTAEQTRVQFFDKRSDRLTSGRLQGK